MITGGEERRQSLTAARVRQNTGNAAFAAICLLFFGFGYFSPPAADSLFTAGDALFAYTLRVGGVAMACVAIACLGNKPVALLLDAIVSFSIGALLIVSAAMMILGGGFGLNKLLYVLFGGMFIVGAIRNGRDYGCSRHNDVGADGAGLDGGGP
jgi:hypothetical protein